MKGLHEMPSFTVALDEEIRLPVEPDTFGMDIILTQPFGPSFVSY